MTDNKNLKLSDRSHEDIQRDQVKENIVDTKSTMIGLFIFLLIITGLILYKVTDNSDSLEPKEFVFKIFPPKPPEPPPITDPVRKIVNKTIEKPDVPSNPAPPTIKPTAVPKAAVKISPPDIPLIAVSIDDPADIIIQDDVEIGETVSLIEYKARPMNVSINNPADIFLIEKTSPKDRPENSTITDAPASKQRIEISSDMFSDLNSSNSGLGDLDKIGKDLFGKKDFAGIVGKGGGKQAHTAVDMALRWLVQHQETDGHWIAPKWDKAIPDEQQKDVKGTHNVGITAFSLLALMGGGHTIRKGDYRRNVLRGIQWLVKQQKANGMVSSNMYEHAIATIAICEAFGRSPDEEIGKAARKAVSFCEYAVAADGGWRYRPKSQSQ
ncbi:MAG: terpene cyclase/mutase family protein [Lentisphaeria bacterium]|nr:hypothetical protein [Lentisphaeria bacterium]NQZ69954.1 terpene cyclase/mutase family protein [Lentisphaeria bacterium]